MAEITQTQSSDKIALPKYPEIEETKLDVQPFESGNLSAISKALNINLPSTGIPSRQKVDEIMVGVGTKLNNLTKQIEETKARTESAALDTKQKYYDDINKKEEESTNESKRKLKEVTEAGLIKFAPTQENIPQLGALFSSIGIVGAILGGGGRNSAMNALSSMTGMMEGYKKGQIERFKQEKVMFDEHLAQLKTERENIIQEMKQIAEEFARDKTKGQERYENFLAKLNSQILKDVNRVAGIQGVMNTLFTSLYDGAKNMETLNREMTMESIKYGHEIAKEKLKAGLAGGGEAYALVNTYKLQPDEISRLNKDQLPLVAGKVESARVTSELADMIKANPSAAGIAGDFLNRVDKYLPGRYGESDTRSAAPLLKDAIDRDTEISGNQDDITQARVIAKKVLDVINARALSVSKRLLVSELKMQKDVLDIKNLSAKTAPEVYKNLAKDDLAGLARYGITNNSIDNLNKTFINKTPIVEQPTVPAGIPEGSVFVGKAGDGSGRNVYRAPDGKQYVEKGK
jgi:hypothetical protein